MKFSEQWLREWVNPDISTEELLQQLTMAGLEVDHCAPVAGEFNHVIIGEVLTVEAHPEADRLNLCDVEVGGKNSLKIVCGAKNVRAGLKVPVAMIGAKIGDLEIKKAKLRGALSEGMICSEQELGIAESSNGIMELANDAPIGQDFRQYLQLNDNSIDIDLTPNRGDCLGVAGVARDVGVINRCELNAIDVVPVPAQIDATFPIELVDTHRCPHYVGRIIKNIDPHAVTPLWMQERLRRSGLRSIAPVVDVTNYVMLELGQPMHAFDFAKLKEGIVVRLAKSGEKLTLLDGQEMEVIPDTLLIADKQKPLALAGIMGGEDSSVTDDTRDIFLESAFFAPVAISGHAREYSLSTDSSHRFERGVDPELQVKAIERATELLLEIVGGKPGPVLEESDAEHIPQPKIVALRNERVTKVLGLSIDQEEITDILQRLGMTVFSQGERWEVRVPTHRFDISIEEDLIEEIARIYGYDNIPLQLPLGRLSMLQRPEHQVSNYDFSRILVERGYQQAITYSFVDPKIQKLLFPDAETIELSNPISQDLSQMRVSMWPGLISALQYNQNRQQVRCRLFETGLRFVVQSGELHQEKILGGVAAGTNMTEQWGTKAKKLDFYDVKADVMALLEKTQSATEYQFVAAEHPALHPGQAAKIMRGDKHCGWLGALHPRLEQALDLLGPVYLFEVEADVIAEGILPKFVPPSRFPSIRRDISFLVSEKTTTSDICANITETGGELLQDVHLFDVYQGEGIAEGQKSLAVAITLQHPSRTLTDEEVTEVMEQVIASLTKTFQITLRD